MSDKLYKLMNWARIEGVVYSEEDNPHEILGASIVNNGTLIQTFQPFAESVLVRLEDSGKLVVMELVDEEGFFAVLIKDKSDFKYTYLSKGKDGIQREIKEVYNHSPIISKKDADKFNAGLHYHIYSILGAHSMNKDGVEGVGFAVWAPNALRVSVVGDFNNWDGRVHQMRRFQSSGIFELFIPDVKEGDIYKYEIKIKGGLVILKSDPYAFGSQLRPESASVVRDINHYQWHDDAWMSNRKMIQKQDQPISIYEVHLGSFMKPEDGRTFYNYREIAPLLAAYVKEMGYTHVELMPIMEHPLDASWGYQVIGYYAPTSRFGTAEDFMFFMDFMHEQEIAVILDWVPAHFPRDAYGLSGFDGTCLYEHQDPRQGFHPQWGTLIYNYGRPEVKNYLIANALYWVREYHVDGIRMDAVASMLYLDYGKHNGDWVANIYGGNENLDAVEMLKHLNSVLKKEDSSVILIAEESTAWPKVTDDLRNEGLGFDYKWNLGWMNDFLGYMRHDSYYRTHHYGELTFSMIYAYSENYVLALSHDEMVHEKATMLGKMPGELKEKFANLRAVYGFQMTHPGKKLVFMGQDIAETDEWNEKRGVDWELLQYDAHKQMQLYVRTLNQLYKAHPALYQLDHVTEGFEWINNISANENIIVYLRKSINEEESLLVVCNFGSTARDNYKIGVPGNGKYKEIFNSDAVEFGGDGFVNQRLKQSKKDECDNREDSIRIKIASFSTCVFQYTKANKQLTNNETVKESYKNIGKNTHSKKSLKKELQKKFEKEERSV